MRRAQVPSIKVRNEKNLEIECKRKRPSTGQEFSHFVVAAVVGKH